MLNENNTFKHLVFMAAPNIVFKYDKYNANEN